MDRRTHPTAPTPRPGPLASLALLLLALLACGGLAGLTALGVLRQAESRLREAYAPRVADALDRRAPAVVAGEPGAAEVEASARIAFIGPDGRLATIGPDGRDGRVLSGRGTRFRLPAWHPDGRRIAALGVVDRRAGAYLAEDRPDADVSELRPLFRPDDDEDGPIYLGWAPDGSSLAVLASRRRGLGLVTVDAEAGTARLQATGQPFYWDWLPDGALLVHSGIGSSARLDVLRPSPDARGTRERVPDVPRPGFFQAPAVSADGRRWAFAEETEAGERRLVVRRAADEEEAAAARLPHEGRVAMVWSPRGERLAFLAPPARLPVFYGRLRVADPELAEVRTLTEDVAVAFFWAPDGRSLVYLTPVLDGGTEERAARAAPAAGALRVSRSLAPAAGAHRVALPLAPSAASAAQDRESPLLEAWWVPLSGEGPRRIATFRPPPEFLSGFLPFFDQYARSHTLWSPDSDALVLPHEDADGVAQILVARPDGPARVLTEGRIAFWGPAPAGSAR